MRLTQSSIRRIINEEARRIMKEGADENFDVRDGTRAGMVSNDPLEVLENLLEVELPGVLRHKLDRDDAIADAQGLIDDALDEIRQMLFEIAEDMITDEMASKVEDLRDRQEDR